MANKTQVAPSPPTHNSLEVGLRIPVKYWYPTIISVIAFTATGVWWFFNQLAPLETRIAKLEMTRQTPVDADRIIPFLKIKHIQGIAANGTLTTVQEQTLDDVAFELTNERKDLVLIVTGYIGKGTSGKAEDVKASESIAQSIRQQLVKRGLSENRIFARGYGKDVPDFFASGEHLNAAVMECDVLVLMRYFARG